MEKEFSVESLFHEKDSNRPTRLRTVRWMGFLEPMSPRGGVPRDDVPGYDVPRDGVPYISTFQPFPFCGTGGVPSGQPLSLGSIPVGCV